MNEARTPLSGVLEELEIKAGELSPDRFSDKTEQIRAEASERLVKYFIDVMCTIINAKENGQISAQQGYTKMKGLYEIAKENLNNSELRYLELIDDLLSRTQALMKTIKKEDIFNIYNEALNDNVKLPKLDECWKAIKEGYTQFIIIPSDIILNEIITKPPDFIRIDVQELKEDESRKAAARPDGFYTLALSENDNAVYDYPDGSRDSIKQASLKMADFKERLGLNLDGLTIKEYIWAQLFHVSKMAKFITDPKKWGLDFECASYLTDNVINQKSGHISPAVGFCFNNQERPIITIVNSGKGIKNFLPIVPRLAINFSGEKND